MILLPKETQILYNKNLNDFEQLLYKIKSESKKVKKDFLSKNIKNLDPNSNVNDKTNFILEFVPYFNHLIYFGNDIDVVNKLKELGFRSNSLKWLIDITEIEDEIKRLADIEGLLIFPFEYLSLSINHISTKFQIEVYESFLDNINYNGCETNKLSVDFRNILRKKNYILSEKSKVRNNLFEDLMYELIDQLKNQSVFFEMKESEILKLHIKNLSGNTSTFIDSFLFENNGISKRKVYAELFPLFKYLLKDLNLKNETEFYDNNKESFYNNNYTLYKISKIRDVFKMK